MKLTNLVAYCLKGNLKPFIGFFWLFLILVEGLYLSLLHFVALLFCIMSLSLFMYLSSLHFDALLSCITVTLITHGCKIF